MTVRQTIANLFSQLGKRLGRTAPPAESKGPAGPEGNPKDTASASPSAVAKPAPTSSDGGDLHATEKDRLRKLTTWLIGVFGAIATVMVAGSQVSNLGSLDSTTTTSLFGWHQTRFEFAVIGLGLALGSIAVAVALSVWVQTTSDVTLHGLMGYPTSSCLGLRVLRWRVQARVGHTIDQELKAKDSSYSFAEVVSRWSEARREAEAQWEALVVLETEIASLRIPSTIDPLLWTDGDKLKEHAQLLARASELVTLSPSQRDAVLALRDRAEDAYGYQNRKATHRFRFVNTALDDASYLRMRLSFGMVLKYLVVSAVVAGVGIGMFAWATHPPSSALRRSTSVFVIRSSDVANAQVYLGSDCDPSTLKVNVLESQGVAILTAASRSDNTNCSFRRR